MDYSKKIYKHKNKTITEEELRRIVGKQDYGEFYEIVQKLVDDNILNPVKASGKNGRINKWLFNKYRIIKEKMDYTEAYEEIKMLSCFFNHQAYLEKPEEFLKYRKEILALDSFLRRNKEELKVPVSINERSFQIWGKEKLIKDSGIPTKIFNFNNRDINELNFYKTPEPFFEYIHKYEEKMNILIVENKDTWYTIRKIMREKNKIRFKNDYHAVLYGEGKKVLRNNDMLSYYDKEIFNNSSNTYYYFGDLDYEGIFIYQEFKKLYPTLNIALGVDFYKCMLQLANIEKLPQTKAGQEKIDISEFLESFNSEEKGIIKNILNYGKYIPQEILNYSYLDRMNDIQGKW